MKDFVLQGKSCRATFQSPPNTMELAKMIGVSRTKLFDGFNQLYGASPMEYLRLKRIEKAREMVKDKELSMTQIAYDLGYSSSSHFAQSIPGLFRYAPRPVTAKMNAVDKQSTHLIAAVGFFIDILVALSLGCIYLWEEERREDVMKAV